MSDIQSVLREDRVFPPNPRFAQAARLQGLEAYEALYNRSVQEPEAFWADMAAELHWFRRWDRVLEWNFPWAKWFIGGQTNLAFNCVDRHVLAGRRNKAAIIWEGEPGDQRTLTYGDLQREVS